MSINNPNHLKLIELYKAYQNSVEHQLKGKKLFLVRSDQSLTDAILRPIFNIESIEDNQISIELIYKDFKIFFDKHIFLKDFSEADLEKDFCIIKFLDKSYLFYDSQEKKYYQNLDSSSINKFVENILFYQKIINLLEEKLGLYNSPSRELVLSSSSSKEQPFLIGYPSVKPELPSLDLKLIFDSIQEQLNRKDFSPFFKHQICFNLFEVPKEERYVEFLNKYNFILESANLDFEIYLRDFSFEKIRTKFRENRDKYFQWNTQPQQAAGYLERE